MIRDLLKWLACGLVAVLGLTLLTWEPLTLPDGKRFADERMRQSGLTASAVEARGAYPKRPAQP